MCTHTVVECAVRSCMYNCRYNRCDRQHRPCLSSEMCIIELSIKHAMYKSIIVSDHASTDNNYYNNNDHRSLVNYSSSILSYISMTVSQLVSVQCCCHYQIGILIFQHLQTRKMEADTLSHLIQKGNQLSESISCTCQTRLVARIPFILLSCLAGCMILSRTVIICTVHTHTKDTRSSAIKLACRCCHNSYTSLITVTMHSDHPNEILDPT